MKQHEILMGMVKSESNRHILERAIEVSAYQDIIASLQRNDQLYKDMTGNRYMFWTGPKETDGKGFKFTNIDTREERLFQLSELEGLVRIKDSIEDY